MYANKTKADKTKALFRHKNPVQSASLHIDV